MDQPAYDFLVVLNDLARSLRTEADRRARLHGVTRAQWIILKNVDATPGMSQRELAELLEVEPITVGRLVDRLEARGMVERKADPADRRIWRLHLCEAARPMLGALGEQRDDILAMLVDGVSPAALAQTLGTLQRMKSNVAVCRKPQKETA